MEQGNKVNEAKKPYELPYRSRYYSILKVLATRYHLKGKYGYFVEDVLRDRLMISRDDHAYRPHIVAIKRLLLLKYIVCVEDDFGYGHLTDMYVERSYRIEPKGMMYLEKHKSFKRLFF